MSYKVYDRKVDAKGKVWIKKSVKGKWYSQDYLDRLDSRGWQLTRKWTLWLALWREPLCPLFKATDADHLHYDHIGHELPMVDLVPSNKYMNRKVLRWLRTKFRKHKSLINNFLRITFLAWFIIWSAPIVSISDHLMGEGIEIALESILSHFVPSIDFESLPIPDPLSTALRYTVLEILVIVVCAFAALF